MVKESNKKYLSTTEAAELLEVSRVSVYKKIKSEKLPAKKVGRNYIIAKEDLAPALKKEVSSEQKEFIAKAVNKIVEEYGETLKKLGKE